MNIKNKENSIVGIATFDSIISVVAYLISTGMIAAMVNAGVIEVTLLKVYSAVSVLVSCVLAAVVTVLVKGKIFKAELLSACILLAVIFGVSICQKRVSFDISSIALTAGMIYIGKVIPFVIKRDEAKRYKRKKKK